MRNAAWTVVLACALACLAGTAALAEEVELRARFAPGDAYQLSLGVTTRTAARSRGVEGRTFEEEVRIGYDASVEVLEVDADGRPVRERHEGVQLTFDRPDERGSLFEPGVAFEVDRRDGGFRIFALDRRADRRLESLVEEVLAGQFEYSLEPALLDPGRPVDVGERWELDGEVAKRFLRTRGLRVIELDGSATAGLERAAGGEGLVLRYRIPIAWFRAPRMPEGHRTAESQALYEGTIRLASDPRRTPVSHSSRLTLSLSGSPQGEPGVARALPWTLERSQVSEQRTVMLESASPGLAREGSFVGTLAAAPAPRP